MDKIYQLLFTYTDHIERLKDVSLYVKHLEDVLYQYLCTNMIFGASLLVFEEYMIAYMTSTQYSIWTTKE